MYNNIKLEKGLYSITGKTFTQALAELDPDANYENTELKGLDAFERQLKRFDIKVKGANSDRVEKFFISTVHKTHCQAGHGRGFYHGQGSGGCFIH